MKPNIWRNIKIRQRFNRETLWQTCITHFNIFNLTKRFSTSSKNETILLGHNVAYYRLAWGHECGSGRVTRPRFSVALKPIHRAVSGVFAEALVEIRRSDPTWSRLGPCIKTNLQLLISDTVLFVYTRGSDRVTWTTACLTLLDRSQRHAEICTFNTACEMHAWFASHPDDPYWNIAPWLKCSVRFCFQDA
jgi:hypothetical protein